MDTGQDMVDIGTAAVRMGVTPEAVRKRISRGTIPAAKQDGRWYIVEDGIQAAVQDAASASGVGRPVQDTGRYTGQDVQGNRPDGRDVLVAELQDRIDNLQEQLRSMNQALSSRDNQITELVTVVRQTQAMLPPPAAEHKSWWRRFWES